ncbi:uncharacterized protein B0H18DRAFT_1023814 [Fomitopsis serialis]|uniref:uncharacterized protein n=1 Tax=Fomitopsis serialis TaxID=139415 RepID=UPI00200758B1|nr:uncharacterized protein B0H18DRAFT_1023814 [Neoantrodia serialis]KAH9920650.1 hypothetical protein B0H18DRAFT_1023814 [Neoantrodia serialis]
MTSEMTSLDTGIIQSSKIAQTSYNRNWRRDINESQPPALPVLRRSYRDAEFDEIVEKLRGSSYASTPPGHPAYDQETTRYRSSAAVLPF